MKYLGIPYLCALLGYKTGTPLKLSVDYRMYVYEGK